MHIMAELTPESGLQEKGSNVASLKRSVAIFVSTTQDEQDRQFLLYSTSVAEFSFVELNAEPQQQSSYYCIVAIFTDNLVDLTKHFST